MIGITMYLTIGVCSMITVALLYFLAKPNEKNVIAAPSMLTSFGIFGTFLGVAIGLWNFNSQDIVSSVPVFLGGIKLAFWSSVVGILAAIVHRFKFLISPLESKSTPEAEADSRFLQSLDKMNTSLESLNNQARNREAADRDLHDFGENLIALGDKMQSGLQSMSGSLKDGFGNLALGVSEQARLLTDELKAVQDLHDFEENLAALGDKMQSGLQSMSGSLKDGFDNLALGVSEQARLLTDELKAVELSVQARALADELKADNSILEVFADLKKQIESGSELNKEVSRQQMEELFSGLSRTAAGTLGEFSDIAGKIIEQAKWQGANIAEEIAETSEASTKAMLGMLTKILGATEDSNRRVVGELAKLRTDVASDMKLTTDQSKALVEQLQAMTESYKASLVSTTTDLKAQISKDMKSSYGLIDTYTKNVTEVTSTNQLEALERLEAIANIMQSVVESSTDMTGLLHDNTIAMTNMKEALTGTNEGSLGRFLLNMNEKVIEQLTSLESSLAAQGSLGILMGDLNAELLKRFRSLEKMSEVTMHEARLLPKEIAKGLVELKGNGEDLFVK